MILGWALLEHGEHLEALERLQPTVTEIEGFGFPQWQALTAVFAAEALRREGRLAEAESWSNAVLAWRSGQSTGTRWDSLSAPRATSCAIKGCVDEANAKLAEAVSTFDRIGASFEAQQSR